MADATHIEWTDATWNPVTGCSVVSPGCTNCYAMKWAGTRLRHHPSRAGLTTDTKAGPVWNGQVRFNAEWLDQPLRWTRPRRIFVCAHGDLFHEEVPDAWIDQVFAVMALAPQHTFQVLTKRAARMRRYLTAEGQQYRVDHEIDLLAASRPHIKGGFESEPNWPLPNVWLGVSAEDQPRADERIGELVATPAAVRFVSLEPMLGPIELRNVQAPKIAPDDEAEGWRFDALEAGEYYFYDAGDGYTDGGDGPDRQALDWVILGGESGPGARPMHPDWARQVRDDCAAAGVAFFFKQWGAWGTGTHTHRIRMADGNGSPFVAWPDGAISHGHARDHGGDGVQIFELGKKAAGRLLDGVEHNAMPAARAP